MSTLSHQPPLRLLERPTRVAPVEAPVADEVPFGRRLVQWIDRYFAWGERHTAEHRYGAWLKH